MSSGSNPMMGTPHDTQSLTVGRACPACGSDASRATPEAPYCWQCGTSQFIDCHACEAPVFIDQPFCNHCGLAIAQLMSYRKGLDEAIEKTERDAIDEALQQFRGLRQMVGREASDLRSRPVYHDLVERIDQWLAFVTAVSEGRRGQRMRELVDQMTITAPGSSLVSRIRVELAGDEPSAAPEIDGFAWLGFERFHCSNDTEGEKRFRGAVYRNEAFARAARLGPGERAPDTEFVLIPPVGYEPAFVMGSPSSEKGRDGFRENQHPVVFSHHYLIARTAVSQRVFLGLGGRVDVERSDPLEPIIQVPWNHASAWCFYRTLQLATEAQWECACRGGTGTPFAFGSDISSTQVNYDGRYPYGAASDLEPSIERPVRVGSLPANAFGLHEMHGNVWEWVLDRYGEYPPDATQNPKGPASGQYRIMRGGAWSYGPAYCRSAYRGWRAPELRRDNFGFRVLMHMPEQ